MNKSKISVDTFNTLAKQYQDKYMDLVSFHESFDLFLELIEYDNDKVKILEVGCGPGNITQYLLRKNNSLNILGIDLAPKMIELARINNPVAQFKEMDARDISELNDKYDGIMSGFCLPYLSKEKTLAFIFDSYQLLKENGVLYISTMEDENENSYFQYSNQYSGRVYINFHEYGYLEKALIKAGFFIKKIIRKEILGHPESNAQDLVIIAIKKVLI